MKFYGQFSPPVDQVIFERYRKYIENRRGTFIECGAFDGVTESNCKFLEESFGWKGVNVEPFPHHFEKLVRNRPNSINLNYALSSVETTCEFTHVVHPELGDDFGNGSLSHSEQHQEQLRRSGCRFQPVTVRTRTYDQVIAEAELTTVDLLSLDVEGHEVQVLEGMNARKGRPRVICIETGHDTCGLIDKKLRSMGYRRDGEYLVNSFYVRRSWFDRWLRFTREAA